MQYGALDGFNINATVFLYTSKETRGIWKIVTFWKNEVFVNKTKSECIVIEHFP